jgi:CheY-like chemotaxis protein
MEELPKCDRLPDWFFEQIHPNDRSRTELAYHRFLEGRDERYDSQMRLWHKQGHWVWGHDIALAIERDASGSVRRLAGMLFDITQHKLTEEALHALNANLTKLAASRTMLAERQANELRRLATGLGRAGKSPDADATSSAEGTLLRVLIVDDHALVREGMVGLLECQAEFQVIGQASDGRQAIHQASELRPDAIIMDVDMPGMDGIEATRRIKQTHPDMVIVGLSLHDEEAVARAMIEAGADTYVSKYAPAKEFVSVIRAACAWRRTPPLKT